MNESPICLLVLTQNTGHLIIKYAGCKCRNNKFHKPCNGYVQFNCYLHEKSFLFCEMTNLFRKRKLCNHLWVIQLPALFFPQNFLVNTPVSCCPRDNCTVSASSHYNLLYEFFRLLISQRFNISNEARCFVFFVFSIACSITIDVQTV